MSDLVNNNQVPIDLGTISYDTPETSFYILETDSIGNFTYSSDFNDWFIINTEGIDKLKIDIHPISLTDDYHYSFSYSILDYKALKSTSITMIGDEGEFDNYYDYSSITDYMDELKDNYYTKTTTSWGTEITSYYIVDETSFESSTDSHLIVNPSSDGTVLINVNSVTYETLAGAEEISYIIDITPISSSDDSSSNTETETYLSSLGLTSEQANSFIMSNIDNLLAIYVVAKQYGVTNDMIAEILQKNQSIDIDGIFVANYFAQNGIDSNDLGGSERTIEVLGVNLNMDSISSIDIIA